MSKAARPARTVSGRPRCHVEWSGLEVSVAARSLAERAVELALKRDKLRQRSLCVLVVDDAESAKLHDTHFADATPTDVMSFPDGSPDPSLGLTRLGDLAIGLDVARRVAAQRGRPIDEELALYVLHGTLHLLGYDDIDDSDCDEMWALQRAVMGDLGVTI